MRAYATKKASSTATSTVVVNVDCFASIFNYRSSKVVGLKEVAMVALGMTEPWRCWTKVRSWRREDRG